ncbi:MAG TPA: cytochrome b N-terminal domain-containing protein [Polyangia bacterium]|nr:cytochrome b N-terminal domain-containing protein [Polyangia bacterium]
MSEHKSGSHGHSHGHGHAHGHARRASAPARVAAWLDQRTGYSAVVKLITDEPISGGPRWWYVFGSVLTFLLVLEFVTGLLMSAYYDPSVSGAWASTAFIQDTLSFGWFIRGLHSFGSSALIVLTVVHTLQVVLFGAYKAPREMGWLTGLVMMALLLLFALSGYGLPWDEKGYSAKQVDFMITGTAPILGPLLLKILQGGDAMGNYTVTHMNMAHTMALPALAVLMLIVHIAMVRRHGVTPKWGTDEVVLARNTKTYWPYQASRDAVACGVTFLVLALIVIKTHGAELAGPADPTGTYQARPEWYMLPVYQIRKYFEGPLEMLVVVAMPAIAAVILGSLPWLDRAPDRSPRNRKPILLASAFGTVMLCVLGYMPIRHDNHDAGFQQSRAEAEDRSRLARTLAKSGVLPEGGLAVYRNDPNFQARELWNEHCAKCHSFTGQGGKDGPDLKDYNSRAWILGFLRNPQGTLYMAGAKMDKPMKPVSGTDEELAALTELIYAETGAKDVDRALVQKATPLLSDKDCDSCHDFDGTSANAGPNLKGRGTLEYVTDVIADAGEDRLFGAKNKMPRFAGKLSPIEIGLLAHFVLSESRR